MGQLVEITSIAIHHHEFGFEKNRPVRVRLVPERNRGARKSRGLSSGVPSSISPGSVEPLYAAEGDPSRLLATNR
jgi:hypothetical protein